MSAKQYSSRTADKFVVRLPEGMRERIADVSKDNHRSMNSEIVSRLEASLIADELGNHPAVTIGVDAEGNINMMPSIESWIPSIGQLVCERRDISAIAVIKSFAISDKGIVLALLENAKEDRYHKPLGEIQPFVVQ